MMAARKYSVEEIDALRQSVWDYHRLAVRTYTSESVEEQLRTYMLNGTLASEIDARCEIIVEQQRVERTKHMNAVENAKKIYPDADVNDHGVGYGIEVFIKKDTTLWYKDPTRLSDMIDDLDNNIIAVTS